ncbi:MAG: thioredoxin family protein [Spirochaetes bacterium]|nr:MAG: thioredoxin family protein [Spirochaetota bacterium]
MTVQILGTGCPSCKKLKASAADAISELSLESEIMEITNVDEIMNMGVMRTPALAIDGVVKSVGKVLTKDQVKTILAEV